MNSSDAQPSVFASGYLVFRRVETTQFLLMRHRDRWDLPKGHVDEGETIEHGALRELWEETGIPPTIVWTDPDFAFRHRYWVKDRQNPGQLSLKELTIFLGILEQSTAIRCTEHEDFRWWDWNPPHRIQAQTIDPLLADVDTHLHANVPARQRLGLT